METWRPGPPSDRSGTDVIGWLRWVGPRRVLGGIAVVVVVAIIGWWFVKPDPPDVTESLATIDPSTSTSALTSADVPTSIGGLVVVHVAGSVVSPGVYSLAFGSRVIDAVSAAGGALPRARPDALNLAELVRDGEQIYVPAIGESVPASATSPGETQFPLDINAATAEQLDQLPGVGPATAAAIVARRAEVGRFVTIDDLLDVPGLGPAKVDAMRSLVRI